MTIAEVDFDRVRSLASRAAREHVSISPTAATRWFAVQDGELVRGVAGLLALAGGALRIKGVWVEPEQRGRGLGDALVQHLIALARDECASSIEAYAHNPGYYLAQGFRSIGQRPNGATRVRKVL